MQYAVFVILYSLPLFHNNDITYESADNKYESAEDIAIYHHFSEHIVCFTCMILYKINLQIAVVQQHSR